MKKTLMTALVICMGCIMTQAQKNNVGAGIAYGSEVENMGLGVNAEFSILPNLTISPSFIYFFPEKNPYVTLNLWEINGNVNYYFLNNDKMGVYGLGGLNYTHASAKSDFLGYSNTAKSGEVGLNLGGGFKYHLNESWSPVAELKYVIGDYDQLVMMVGMKYNF